MIARPAIHDFVAHGKCVAGKLVFPQFSTRNPVMVVTDQTRPQGAILAAHLFGNERGEKVVLREYSSEVHPVA